MNLRYERGDVDVDVVEFVWRHAQDTVDVVEFVWRHAEDTMLLFHSQRAETNHEA